MNNRETQGDHQILQFASREREAPARDRPLSRAPPGRQPGRTLCLPRTGGGNGFTPTTPSTSDETTKAPESPRPLMLVCKSRLRRWRRRELTGDGVEHLVEVGAHEVDGGDDHD